MRVLVVEDEPVVARRVAQFARRILGERLEWLQVSATFGEAQSTLAGTPIDVLLLDLNLDGSDGMSLLDAHVSRSFHTIIISANADQALAAFERGVIDFVAKPFSEQRLAEALRRVTDPEARSPHAARYLAVRKSGRIELVGVDDVLYVRGADDYSELVLRDGRRELHDKSLERLQGLLPADFERIHRSYLVRLSAAKALRPQEGSGYELELRSGERLPVGRTRYPALRERLL
ncbi:MAG: response regulator transcription factor [Opitutaceae bacterium]|nr:response regulator transcription factor [Opitutaceae bacterium]